MQRHTGTAWEPGDYVRPKKNPLPTPDKAVLEKAAKTIVANPIVTKPINDCDFKK
jgi:hypothetical protein